MTIRMSYAATPHPPAAHQGPLWSRAHEATMRECLARSDQRRGVARLEAGATHVRVGYASWSDAEYDADEIGRSPPMPLSSAQCEVGPTSPCGEKGLRDRTGVEQWQGSWSVPYRRESDTLPCRWSCSMGMTSAEHLQRPLPTTKQPVPLTARQAVLRGILFVRGGLRVGGLYRSAVGRMRFRDPGKNTPSPKF